MEVNIKKLILPVAHALYEIMEENENLDRTSSGFLKENPHWSEEYRGFFAETLIESVRWFRLLESSTITNYSKGVGYYFELIKVYLFLKSSWTAKELGYTSDQAKLISSKFKNSSSKRVIRESIPDWLDEIGEQELKESWDSELEALNILPTICLRPNLLKVQIIELQKILSREGFDTLKIEEAVVLKHRANIFRSKSFFDGLFEVQDISSQQVAPFLQVESGMRVIDACAGTGGKSLHLSTLMNNKGKLIALDTEEWKLKELKVRAARAGVSIIESKVIDSTKVIKRLADSADRLLLDVPCSGLGVLRRNPDSKWRLSPERLDELKKIQREILRNYTKMLKVGGKVVYSTCSILPSENQQQIEAFLAQSNGSFVLEEEKTISPAQSGFDGFYMARMVRVS